MSNASGEIISQAIYDPWGKRSDIMVTNPLSDLNIAATTDRGFTGHKHLDALNIIHMKGRIYDPTLGRFLQADPHIQAPTNTQSYNRYSYVWNNPLNATDPSGYISIFKGIRKFVKKHWRTIVAAVATVVTYGAASGWVAGWGAAWGTAATATSAATLTWAGGAAAGAFAGFVGGAISTGSLRGAMNGALSGAVFGGIGASGLGDVAKVGAHALGGGILSDLQGGNFGHGFWMAGVMKVAGMANSASSNASVNEIAGRATIQAMVGGTLSRVTGGKFANGAISSAIQYVVNAQSDNIRKGWKTFSENTSRLWSEFKGYWSDTAETEVNMYATAAKNSILKDLPDDQGLKVGGCAGIYFGGCAQLVVTNEGIIWSRGAGRVFGFSGGGSYVFKNALATDSATSWETSIALGPIEASYELDMLPNSTPQFGFEAAPTRFGLSINHTLMKHTYYRGD